MSVSSQTIGVFSVKLRHMLTKWLEVLLPLFIAFIIVSQSLQYLHRRKFAASHGCKPCTKFPSWDPILGLDFMKDNVKAFKSRRFLKLLSDRITRGGPTWVVRVFLTRQSVFTADPDNVKTIMSLKFKDFELNGRRPVMGPLLGGGIFTTDGDEWAHSRALLRPYFSKDQVADLALIELHVDHLFKHLPKDGTTVDLQPLFHCFTLDSATDFLFGQSTNTLTDAKERDLGFARALRYSLDHMAYLLIAGRLKKLRKADPNFAKSNDICRSYVDTFVDEVMRYKNNDKSSDPLMEQGESRQGSFLRDLANTTDDKDKIRGELLSLLLAGRDTTASLLSSLFWEFSRRPDVWRILCDEIRELDGQRPTYEQLRDLKYSRYCINESKSCFLDHFSS